MKRDDQELELLVRLQRGLPLTARPFQCLGVELELAEDAVLAQVQALFDDGLARRFGGVFDGRRLGYDSTLVAVDVPDDALPEAAARVTPEPGVTHCYARDGRPSLWFTVTAPADRLPAVFARLAASLAPWHAVSLPARRTFKIGVVLDPRGLDPNVRPRTTGLFASMPLSQRPPGVAELRPPKCVIEKHSMMQNGGRSSATPGGYEVKGALADGRIVLSRRLGLDGRTCAPADPSARSAPADVSAAPPAPPPTPRERALVRRLQQSLPLEAAPFAALAAELGWREGDLLARLESWQQAGVLRRVGLVLRHREAGFHANVLCAWQVADDRLENAGRALARGPEITHCYERVPHPLFPFNLFAMLHAATRPAAAAAAARRAAAAGLGDARLLCSTREFKKSSPVFFAEDAS